MKTRWEFNSFSITLRELLVAFIISAVLIILGEVITDKIDNNYLSKETKYTRAQRTDNPDIYNFLIDTNSGYVLAYGTAAGVGGVTMDGIDGTYWSIKCESQKYTKHRVPVTKYKIIDGEQIAYTEYEEQWTWDTVATKSEKVRTFMFLGREYRVGALPIMPTVKQIASKSTGYHTRDIYYAAELNDTGTLFTKIEANTNMENEWFPDKTIEEVLIQKEQEGNTMKFLFWLFYGIGIVAVVCMYIYKDNDYLED